MRHISSRWVFALASNPCEERQQQRLFFHQFTTSNVQEIVAAVAAELASFIDSRSAADTAKVLLVSLHAVAAPVIVHVSA